MAAIRRIEELEAWRRARQLVREIYRYLSRTKLGKDFVIRDQLSKAAISGMSNIAEGFARHTDRDFAHFLDIARGSLCEVQSLLYVALDIQYLSPDEFRYLHGMAGDTIRLVTRLIAYLRSAEPQKGTVGSRSGNRRASGALTATSCAQAPLHSTGRDPR